MYGAAGAALATTIAEFLVLLVQFIYTKELLKEVRREFRLCYYLILCGVAGFGAYFVKYISVRNFFSLVISAVVYFGIYGLGLMIVKEPIMIDTLNGIRNRIKKG